jgi:hypothetical protein
LQLLQLRDWHFSQLPGGEMPDDLDDYLRDAGYVDATQFHTAIFAEYVYRQQVAEAAGAADVSGLTENDAGQEER